MNSYDKIEEELNELKIKYDDIKDIIESKEDIKSILRTEDMMCNHEKIRELQNKYIKVFCWRESFYGKICERKIAKEIIIDQELIAMCREVENVIKVCMDKQSELLWFVR